MYGRVGFQDCIKANLKGKGFGEKKTEEILGTFTRKVNIKMNGGMAEGEASFQAMRETLEHVEYRARKKLQQANKNFEVAARLDERIKQAYNPNILTSSLAGDRGAGFKGGIGSKIARAVISILDDDPGMRFKGRNFEANYYSNRDRYIALLGDAMDPVRKGAFGTQSGKAHLPNIVRELFGIDTGDVVAKRFAEAYRKLQNEMIDHFNRVGGDIVKRLDFNMPQWQNSAKLTKAGIEKWVADHMRWIDWNKTLDDEGNLIAPDKREQVLRDVYQVISTEGAINIDPKMFGGRGHSVANMIDKHRFLVFKDANSWLEMHAAYGDGNAFDVIMEHINDMARKTALVDTFGTNPSMWIDQAKARARAEAGVVKATAQSLKRKGKDLNAVSEADEGMRRAEDMFKVITRKNSVNVDNVLANTVTTTSNLLTAAQLTGAVVAAIPGDTLNSAFIRFAKRMPVFSSMSHLLTDMVQHKPAEDFMANSGFIFDELASSHYAAERYTGLGTYGAPWSRVVSDSMLRLSALTRWTNSARGTAIRELMSLMGRNLTTEFDDLPFQQSLRASGITKRDWDAVRKAIPAWTPAQGTRFLRPLDIMSSKLIDRDNLYAKFYGFVFDNSRHMVPNSTIEASVILKGASRPDTVGGAILHSFSMYKNFPATLAMMYGRLLLNSAAEGGRGRVALAAGMLISLTMAGAMAVQMRELTKGKTPQDMTMPMFWMRAISTGGGLGIWGDLLFGGAGQYGNRSIPAQIGGPLASAVADTVNLPYRWATTGEIAPDLVQYAKRYTPGSNLWYARLALSQEVWDRLEEYADPKIASKRRRRQTEQRKLYGNSYYIKPGERLFTE